MKLKVTGVGDQLAADIVSLIQRIRKLDLKKHPSISETLDWTRALVALDREALDESVVEDTLGALLKYRDDIDKVRGERAKAILERVAAGV